MTEVQTRACDRSRDRGPVRGPVPKAAGQFYKKRAFVPFAIFDELELEQRRLLTVFQGKNIGGK